MSRRSFINDPGNFCYVYGQFNALAKEFDQKAQNCIQALDNTQSIPQYNTHAIQDY